jgi:hypothetical protein
VPAAKLLAADAERRQCPVDRGFADPAARREPFAQANHAGKRIDDDKPVIGRASDEEAAIVCAQIERAIGVT